MRYTTTYATTALARYTGQNNKMISDDLDNDWFVYTGSNIETTRDFCRLLTAKRYIHRSEIPNILKGNIDGEQCGIYSKTGLPYGMIEGTTVENFQCNCGGWNCRHQLVPIADAVVPQALRDKFKQIRQKVFNKEGKEGSKLGRAQAKAVQQQIENIPIATLSENQIRNGQRSAQAFGIKVSKPMSFEMADERKANVDYKPRTATEENCAVCVVVYEMRRRGLNLTALPYDEKVQVMENLQKEYASIWKNEKGGTPQPTIHDGRDFDEMKNKLLAQCSSVGRYHLGLNWKDKYGNEYGHVLTAERLKDKGIIFYAPQTGEFVNIDDYKKYDMTSMEGLRVDRLIVDEKKLLAICRPLENN